MNGKAAKPFAVLVDDNFDYMDEEKRYKHGDYATLAEAVQACQAIVDACLQRGYRPGISATKLYEGYVAGGEDPFIIGPDAEFSAWTYAKERCEALCGGFVERKDTLPGD
jgi:hypothetical protein